MLRQQQRVQAICAGCSNPRKFVVTDSNTLEMVTTYRLRLPPYGDGSSPDVVYQQSSITMPKPTIPKRLQQTVMALAAIISYPLRNKLDQQMADKFHALANLYGDDTWGEWNNAARSFLYEWLLVEDNLPVLDLLKVLLWKYCSHFPVGIPKTSVAQAVHQQSTLILRPLTMRILVQQAKVLSWGSACLLFFLKTSLLISTLKVKARETCSHIHKTPNLRTHDHSLIPSLSIRLRFSRGRK